MPCKGVAGHSVISKLGVLRDRMFAARAGALRVLNDDLVTARNGFGAHPHRDAEIFSYVVDGELSHRDNLGNQEALGRGSVQFLSAGTGIVHSVSKLEPSCCRARNYRHTQRRLLHACIPSSSRAQSQGHSQDMCRLCARSTTIRPHTCCQAGCI